MFTELKAIFKDGGVILFFIILPIAYPLLYSWIYNNEKVYNIPVALIDNSHTAKSREFAQKLDASPDLAIEYHCSSIEEAKQLIGKGDVYGIIYIPADFAQNIGRGEQTHVSVYCDMSYMLVYKAIFSTATSVALDMGAEIQRQMIAGNTKREENVSVHPLTYEEIPLFNTTEGYGNFIIPAVLLLILHQALLLGIGMISGTERENHFINYRRNKYRNSVMQALTLLCNKTGAYLVIFSVMSAWTALAVPHLFGFVSLIHAQDLIVFFIPYLLACIFFSITISALVRYRENVILIVVFSSVPLLFLSGISWPQSAIPGIWQGIATLFPSTYGIRAFVRMSSMGAILSDVIKEYTALWIQVACYACTAIAVIWDRVKTAERKGNVQKHKENHVRYNINIKETLSTIYSKMTYSKRK